MINVVVKELPGRYEHRIASIPPGFSMLGSGLIVLFDLRRKMDKRELSYQAASKLEKRGLNAAWYFSGTMDHPSKKCYSFFGMI